VAQQGSSSGGPPWQPSADEYAEFPEYPERQEPPGRHSVAGRTSHRAPAPPDQAPRGGRGTRGRPEQPPAGPPEPPAREPRPPREPRPAREPRVMRVQRPNPDRDWLRHDPFAGDDSDAPPWAGPSIYATRAGGGRMGPPAEELAEEEFAGGAVAAPPRRRRPGRAAATRLRRSRRRVYVYCGAAIVLCVVAAAVAVLLTRPSAPPRSPFINSLQPGEFKAVPDACSAVSPSLLSQYLLGQAHQVTVGSSGSSSQCSFTVDRRPVFRVLQVTLQAYQPSLIVAGNGSATAGATDAFAVARQGLISPSKKSPLPRGQVAAVSGLGQQALSALQVLHHAHSVTDFVTVLVRERNVLITVFLQAQASGGGYGPVSVPSLDAGTQAIARQLLAKAETEPKVKR
jgi:hypothetical protein